VKYFLTILGDNILKKTSDLIYFVKPKIKKYLQELEYSSFLLTGYNNIISNFLTKFHHNYDYNKCRLVKMKGNISIDNWKQILEKHSLDIICVATHYSSRHESADQFLQLNNESIRNYTLYLKNNTENDIINNFCENYIQLLNKSSGQETNKKTNITWKNMQYIWKLYLSHYSLPNTIYSRFLKTKLREIYSYNEETDTFYNVTSKYIPFISDFIHFWEKNMSNANNDLEWEMDEICILFKKWCHENSEFSFSNGNINEAELTKILSHFFPHVEIQENKYLTGFFCSLWDKSEDINKVLVLMKQYYSSIVEQTDDMISFEDAYNFYFQYCNKNKMEFKYIVSKRFYEKYIYHYLSEFIEYDTFISPAWYK